MQYPTSKNLINRNEQREKIKSLLSKETEQTHCVLEFFGIAGLGKSRVLEIAKEECRKKELPFGVIDFLVADTSNVQYPDLDILLRICDNLDRFTDFTPGRLFIASLTRNSKGDVSQESKNIVTDNKSLTEFRRYLVESLNGRPLIMMLDSIEQCPDELFNWIGREFLAPLVAEQNIGQVTLFLAGRGPRVNESRWPVALRTATESLRLNPLEFESSLEHIGSLPTGIDYSEAARDIYALSNGHSHSTEAIVYWLGSLGIKVKEVGAQRIELARRLKDEVVRRYILSDAGDWVLSFLEVTCYFRWFTSGFVSDFIQKYRPDLGKDMPVQWYTARLVELQKQPLHLVYLGKDHYRLEPTLQKLLHVVMAILTPDEALMIHGEAADTLERELQKNVEQPSKGLASDNVASPLIVEILYHKAHLSIIVGRKMDMRGELKRMLESYFDPMDFRDLELLDFLKNTLEQDADLKELITQSVLDGLLDEIDAFCTPLPTEKKPFQLSHLTIEYIPPTEYRVSWYQANQQVVPTEKVVSVQQFELNEWRDETDETGKTAFTAYLPERSQNFVRNRAEQAILLTTNRPEVPWELLHDDNDFLCLSRPIGRRPQMLKEAKIHPERQEEGLRALVVGNPTGDLPGADEEAIVVAKALEDVGVVVDVLSKREATAKQFAKKIRNQTYDLIHFAGHAYFEPKAPHLSGLKFYDSPMPAEELGRHLNSRALVFLSACAAGMVDVTESKAGLIGEFVEGIATSVLLGGAIGCIAPMWAVEDGAARDFSIAFYKNLLAGAVIGESVRQARLSAYNKNKQADVWKAWVLYGDPLQIIQFSRSK